MVTEWKGVKCNQLKSGNILIGPNTSVKTDEIIFFICHQKHHYTALERLSFLFWIKKQLSFFVLAASIIRTWRRHRRDAMFPLQNVDRSKSVSNATVNSQWARCPRPGHGGGPNADLLSPVFSLLSCHNGAPARALRAQTCCCCYTR